MKRLTETKKDLPLHEDFFIREKSTDERIKKKKKREIVISRSSPREHSKKPKRHRQHWDNGNAF